MNILASSNQLPENILSKKEFVDIINELMVLNDLNLTIDELVRKTKSKVKHTNLDFTNAFVSAGDVLTIKVLEKMFSSNGLVPEDISYFIYGLDYGRKYTPGCVTYKGENGEDINVDLSSAEKLYDALINNLRIQ